MSFNEWKINKLTDLSEKIGSGATPRGGSNVYLETGIPFIRSQNVYNCEFHEGGLVYIDEESARKLDNVKLCKNDIILNITGDSVARCTILPEKYIGGRVNQHVAIIRTNSKMLNSQFLKYFLVSPSMQAHMLSLARMGATRAALTKGMIESFEIPTPDIKEQEEIAHILSTLDDKIEVNNQINKTLENMAQAIFKQWFVDFEFPNEDGEPYKSSGGEMVESELGMIPKGWEVGKFIDLIEITSGKRPGKRSELAMEDSKYPLVGASSIMGYTDDFNFEEKILVIGRVGTHGVVQRFNNKVWASDNTLVIKSDNYEFAYQILNQIDYKAINRGSTQPLITQTDIKNYTLIIPTEVYLSKFELLVGSLFEIHSNHCIENSKLTEIRDSLLPKLMSGEIRVSLDAEDDAS